MNELERAQRNAMREADGRAAMIRGLEFGLSIQRKLPAITLLILSLLTWRGCTEIRQLRDRVELLERRSR